MPPRVPLLALIVATYLAIAQGDGGVVERMVALSFGPLRLAADLGEWIAILGAGLAAVDAMWRPARTAADAAVAALLAAAAIAAAFAAPAAFTPAFAVLTALAIGDAVGAFGGQLGRRAKRASGG